MSILFENCDLLLRGEDGVYSTLHGFLGVRGDTIDYIGTEKPTGEYEEHKSMEHKLLMPGLINCHNHSPMVLLRGVGSGLPLREWLFDKVFPIDAGRCPRTSQRAAVLPSSRCWRAARRAFPICIFSPPRRSPPLRKRA